MVGRISYLKRLTLHYRKLYNELRKGGLTMNEITLQNMGNTQLDKGIINGKPIIAWDAISNCKRNECQVYSKCSHLKHGKCGVQVSYVTKVTNVVLNRYGAYLDDIGLMKLGLHIIPLYSQLCKMKLLEMALTDVDLVDDRGRVIIHPVYKAIRETLVTINIMWRDLDITMRDPDISSDLPLAANKNGAAGYYDSLSASAEKREITR